MEAVILDSHWIKQHELTFRQGKTLNPWERKFSDLMRKEVEFRREHYSESFQKFFEATGTYANPDVQAEMYFLENPSWFTRLIDPYSPINLWQLLPKPYTVQIKAPYSLIPNIKPNTKSSNPAYNKPGRYYDPWKGMPPSKFNPKLKR